MLDEPASASFAADAHYCVTIACPTVKSNRLLHVFYLELSIWLSLIVSKLSIDSRLIWHCARPNHSNIYWVTTTLQRRKKIRWLGFYEWNWQTRVYTCCSRMLYCGPINLVIHIYLFLCCFFFRFVHLRFIRSSSATTTDLVVWRVYQFLPSVDGTKTKLVILVIAYLGGCWCWFLWMK